MAPTIAKRNPTQQKTEEAEATPTSASEHPSRKEHSKNERDANLSNKQNNDDNDDVI